MQQAYRGAGGSNIGTDFQNNFKIINCKEKTIFSNNSDNKYDVVSMKIYLLTIQINVPNIRGAGGPDIGADHLGAINKYLFI